MDMVGVLVFLTAVIWLRGVEMKLSKKNERWLKERGGIEKHIFKNKAFFFLYHLSICSILVEILLTDHSILSVNYLTLLFFGCLIALKIWCYLSLGKFWNTKNITLPHVIVMKKGPYKLVKQPYIILLTAELFMLPFLFGAYMTAFLFLLIYMGIQKISIPAPLKSKLVKRYPI